MALQILDTINGYFIYPTTMCSTMYPDFKPVNLIGSTFTISSNPALVSIREPQLTSLERKACTSRIMPVSKTLMASFSNPFHFDLYIDELLEPRPIMLWVSAPRTWKPTWAVPPLAEPFYHQQQCHRS